MARTVQTARKSTGGKAPRKLLATMASRSADSTNYDESASKHKKGLGRVKKANKSEGTSNGGSVRSLVKKQSTLKDSDVTITRRVPSLTKANTIQLSKTNSASTSVPKKVSLAKKTSSEKLKKALSVAKKQSLTKRTSSSLKKTSSVIREMSAKTGEKRKLPDTPKAGGKKKKDDEFDFDEEESEEQEEKANGKADEEEDDEEEESDKDNSPKKTPKRSAKKSRKKSSKEDPSDNPCHYLKGEFLAVRSETDGFYICKACQNVYKNTTKVKVYWMEEVKEKPNTYKFEYVEFLHGDYRCIITHCKMKKVGRNIYELPESDLRKIKTILQKGINRQKGIDVSSSSSSEDEGEEEEEEKKEEEKEEEETQPTPKKKTPAKKTPKKDPKTDNEDTPTKKKTPAKKEKAPKSTEKVVSSKAKKSPEKGKGKVPMVKMTSEQKRNPNLLLKARASVKVLQKDPLLETTEPMPCVSTSSYSKLLLRAVNLGDLKLMKKLIEDDKQVSKLDMVHSVGYYHNAIEIAIMKEKIDMAETLFKALDNTKEYPRASQTKSLIEEQGTGHYNYRSLGIARIRKLTTSRGSKEGNNALLKDASHLKFQQNGRKYVKFAMMKGLPLKQLSQLLIASGEKPNNRVLQDNIWLVVRMGHRKLAAELIEKQKKEEYFMAQFNQLHIDVLKNDDEDLKTVRAASARKKPYDNCQITPIHCAAINPNPKYLSKLLSVVPEYGILDGRQRRPIHYAAACEGTGPLEFLLKRGIDPNDVDNQGMTALHIACECERADNVHFMLKKAEKDHEEANASTGNEEDDEIKQEVNKYGIGGVDRPVSKPQNRKWYSYCPIHIAISLRNKNLVEVLLKHGANVHKELGPSRNKNTPLMIAAYSGDLEICKLLIKHGALVEAKDKLKRTALIHAVMSGHAHIASYLISLGANTNHADSSGNTVIHYASAYGWYFCLKLLLDAKADPNIPNDWKVTSLGIAFLKGHMGLADLLLQQPDVDINFRDESGMTLLAIACSSPLQAGIVEQVKYLVEKKGADCTINDVNGNSPLHHLASNSVKLAGYSYKPKISPQAVERSKQIAELLITNGCDPNHGNDDHSTPLMLAVEEANVDMVKLLIEKGSSVSTQSNKENQNILHIMAEQCMNNQFADMISLFQKCTSDEDLKKMATQVDIQGFTPLLKACYNYKNWDGSVVVPDESGTERENEGSEDDEDEDDYDEEEEDDQPPEEEPVEEEQQEEEPEPEEDEDMDQENENTADEEDSPMDEDDDDEDAASDKTDEDVDKIEDKMNKMKGMKKLPSKQASLVKTKEDIIRENQLNESLNFIKALIDICGSDVNLGVQKKTFGRNEKIPEKEKDHYVQDVGKWSPVFMMLNVPAECKIVRKANEDHGVGLNLILSYNPSINIKDVDGRTPLLIAALTCHHKIAEKLLDHDALVNLTSDNEELDGNASPLLIAIKQEDLELCKLLLGKGAKVDLLDSRNQDNAMHYAVRLRGELAVSILDLLIKHGGEVNSVNNKKRTPLHLSVNQNPGKTDSSTEVEAFLIEKGADLFARDCRERLPLHYVFVKIGQFADTSPLDPIELCSTITSAIESNGIDAVDEFGQTPLHRAALRGASVCCMHLIQRGAAINRQDDNGNTPLGMAVFEKHESCSIMLVQKNADINVDVCVPTDSDDVELEENEKPQWKWRPYKETKVEADIYPLFQCVVYNGWQGLTFMTLDVLEDHGIAYNKTIEAAITVNKFNLAMTLIRKQKNVVLNKTDDEGRNLFHILALKANSKVSEDLQKRVCTMLKESGIPLKAKDNYGCSPLVYCALQDNCTAGCFILENCPDVDLTEKDKFGRTPLTACFWNLKHTSTFYPKLLERGAKADILCDYPAITPIMFGNLPKVDYFSNTGNRVLISPLILAISKKDYQTARYLIKKGATLNFPDENKMTPIMYAVKANDKHLVKLLLDTSYDKEEAEKAEKESKEKKIQMLKKKSSRRLFTLGQNLLEQKKEEKAAEAKNEQSKEKSEEDKKKDKVVNLENGLDTGDIDLDQFGIFEKKSDCDLKCRDSRQGWSVVHHLVCPREYGTYDNVELLKILHDAGASVKITDNAGLTPLDYSLIRGAPNLSKALQKLLGVEKNTWERPTYCGPKVHDNVRWDNPRPDFRKDSDIVIAEFERKVQDETDEPWKPDVDTNLDMDKGQGVVVVDEDHDVHYDVLLFKIDVKQGYWGLYNFYKMQIVYQKGKDLYILFNRWGRIGTTGQFQKTPYPKKEDAIKEFCKVFRAKTGNPWKDVKSFQKKPHKYRLVEAEERQKGKKLKEVKYDFNSPVESKLPKYVQDMIKEWTDVTAMKNTMRHYNVDTFLMPFGRIKKSALLKAKDILSKIKPFLKKIEQQQQKLPDVYDPDKYHQYLTEVCELTNDYLHIIPTDGYAYEKVEPIDTDAKLKEHWSIVSALLDLELASKVLAGATYRGNEINPLDYVYRSLGCRVQLMDESEVEAQYLLKYISNTFSGKVEGIFRVSREGEEKKLQECELDNHRLLFHGSSTFNLISILAQGLLVAPPEAPTTGYAFGKGIYTSDEFSKSFNYCHNYGTSKTKYMLVCQVALGKSNEVLQPTFFEELPPTTKSTVAVGRKVPNPTSDITLPSGATIPLGEIIDRPPPTPDPKTGKNRYYSLYNNEYIVYDSSQVCLRYIIQFRG